MSNSVDAIPYRTPKEVLPRLTLFSGRKYLPRSPEAALAIQISVLGLPNFIFQESVKDVCNFGRRKMEAVRLTLKGAVWSRRSPRVHFSRNSN